MANPVPATLEYESEHGEILCGTALIGRLYDADDFPCLDEEVDDLDAIQAMIDATGKKLAVSYNCHDDLLAACEKYRAAQQHFQGCHQCGADLLGNVWYCADYHRLLSDAIQTADAAVAKAEGKPPDKASQR